MLRILMVAIAALKMNATVDRIINRSTLSELKDGHDC